MCWLQDTCSITNRLPRTGGNVENKGWPTGKMEMGRQSSVHAAWTEALVLGQKRNNIVWCLKEIVADYTLDNC